MVSFFNRYPIDCSAGTCTEANGNHDTTEWQWVCNREATLCSNPPSCTEHQYSSTAGDYFGYSVDISNNVAAVGSFGFNSGTGRVYIFEKYLDDVFNGTISSLWQVSKVIDPPVANPATYFGFQVALDKSYLLVTDLKTNDGAGFLFSRNYGGLNNWGLLKKLQQPSIGNGPYQYPTNIGQFNVLNYWSDGYGSHQNGAQVQHEVPYYTANTIVSNSPSPNFGASAKIHGNTVLIGAPFADSDQSDIGSVSLVVVHPTSRQSAPKPLETSFTASDVKSGYKFGDPSLALPLFDDSTGTSVHVTTDSGFCIVGAPNSLVSTASNAGAAYLLENQRNLSYRQVTKLVANDPAENDFFGMRMNGSHKKLLRNYYRYFNIVIKSEHRRSNRVCLHGNCCRSSWQNQRKLSPVSFTDLFRSN